MTTVNKNTKLFFSATASPGNFGATIYNGLFDFYKFNAVYIPRISTNAESLIASLRTLGINGCSISMPLKTKVIPFLDQLDEISTATNSVNTVLNRDGKLLGFNTDYFGINSVISKLKFQSALIYGSGSVVSSLLYALRQAGISKVALTGRNQVMLNDLANRYDVEIDQNDSPEYDLLINATPSCALTPNEVLLKKLKHVKCAFDLVVSPRPTVFASRAKDLGIPFSAGIEMSAAQLCKQFEIYTQIKPDIALVSNLVQLYIDRSQS